MNDDTDDNINQSFDSLLNAIMGSSPDMMIRLVDDENKIISELMFVHTMPECVVCGTNDVDQAFQDPRFMDGQTLCEFCYVPRVIEWERTHK